MTAAIELPYRIDLHTVERAQMLANQWKHEGRTSPAQQGLRAARAQDPKILLALEKALEVLDKAAEDQTGRTRRDYSRNSTNAMSDRAVPLEVGVWRSAYETATKGEGAAHPNFSWIYAAAGVLAGLVT